jgi:DNA-binding protein H-NS
MAVRKLNLKSMELAELVKLRDEVDGAISKRVLTERKALEAKIADLGKMVRRDGPANGSGSSQSTVRAVRKHALNGTKAKPKYRGPDGVTWAGRGHTPRWLAELEKAGRKRDEFLIGARPTRKR